MRDAPVSAGEILAGKYRVERVLGTGAMGVVVAATHLALDQPVALKFMVKRGSSAHYPRFVREARIAAMLRSQHVARVHDVGTLESGAPYIVMDLLEGHDLERLLKMRGPLPIGEAVEYILQACEPIAEANAAGVIHRDLKPANLFLARGVQGALTIKVLDFGISKLMTSDLELTKTGDSIGSPLYMAPEQMRSARDVDARADLYALGAILYELIVGKTPFHADSYMELCTRLLHDEATPITSLRADIPLALAAAIMRSVEKDPRKRWPDVESFAAEIAPFATPLPQPLRGASAASLASIAPPALSASSALSGTSQRARARRPFVLAAGVIALTAAAIATLIAFNQRAAPPPPSLSSAPTAITTAEPKPTPSAPSEEAPSLPLSAAPEPIASVVAPSASAPSRTPPSATPAPAKRSAVKAAASVDYDQR